jgi:hypothetical protein
MLDYTLVSPKATYRVLAPADLPFFLRMAETAGRQRGAQGIFDPGRVLATVKELQPSRGRGSIFVFERSQRLVGYCILVNRWSSEECGTVLVADQLYVTPELQEEDLAGDFLLLLARVAPQGATSIQLELPRGRRSLTAFSRLGFRSSDRDILSLPIPRG